MKRFLVAAVLCAMVAPPTWAQERRLEGADRADVPAAGASLNLRAILHQKALEIAAYQVPQAPQTPAAAAPQSPPPEKSGKAKALYLATLAGAVGGTIFNIVETRRALDHHLGARTFPLVWKTTRDPNDKSSVTGIIAGSNGALLAVGAFVFARGNAPLATFVNLLVGGATTAISLHDRSIINDCESKGNCQ
jgi:hypothetical protein